MNRTMKFLCLILSVVLSVCCFASCGKDTSSNVSSVTQSDISNLKPTEVIEAVDSNDLPDYDLNGVILKVASGFPDVLFPDEEVNELFARRKKWIDDCKTKYNFELEDVYYPWDKSTETLLPDLLAGSYVADICLPAVRQAGPFVQARLCVNLKNPDFSKYLDLSKPWWDQSMLNASTINGKTYCCNPQFTSAAEQSWVVFFNRDMAEEIGYDPDSLYKLQKEGKWTWDKMEEMGKKAVKDLNNDGVMDQYDRWGITGAIWHVFNAFVCSGNVDYVVEKDHRYMYNLQDSETISKFTKLNEIFAKDKMYFASEAGASDSTPGAGNMFALDRALFYTIGIGDCSAKYMREMESDFGILLMPKYNEQQKDYLCRTSQYAPCCFIPVTVQYKSEAAFALQALSFSAWKVGVPDVMELNFAQYTRDDGSEYAVYEVFNHSTFTTIDQLLFAVGLDKTWLEIINPELCRPIMKEEGADVSGRITSISSQCQVLLDEFYQSTTMNDN